MFNISCTAKLAAGREGARGQEGKEGRRDERTLILISAAAAASCAGVRTYRATVLLPSLPFPFRPQRGVAFAVDPSVRATLPPSLSL